MSSTKFTPDTPLFIVLNAASGSGDTEQAATELEQILRAAGRRFEILRIDHPQRIQELARRAVNAAVDNDGAVVVAAGDGTINTVAQAVLPTGRPMGILPHGTFNYSCRAHSIPLDTAAATRALASARVKPIQVGVVNDRIFLVNASLGLYPELLEDREEYKKRFGRHRSVALWAGLMTLLRSHRELLLEIDHDQGRETVRTLSLFVGNNPLQLEQVGLPEADAVKRQRLAAVMPRSIRTAALLWLALRGALGQLGAAENVRDFSFRSLTVQRVRGSTRRGVKIATDGEIHWLRPPLRFSIAPQPLNLLVPSEPTPDAADA